MILSLVGRLATVKRGVQLMNPAKRIVVFNVWNFRVSCRAKPNRRALNRNRKKRFPRAFYAQITRPSLVSGFANDFEQVYKLLLVSVFPSFCPPYFSDLRSRTTGWTATANSFRRARPVSYTHLYRSFACRKYLMGVSRGVPAIFTQPAIWVCIPPSLHVTRTVSSPSVAPWLSLL